MMYVPIHKRDWPLGLDEIEYLARVLKGKCYDYEVQVATKLFAGLHGPKHMLSIIKWGRRRDFNDSSRREIIWEGDDSHECAGMLRLLIAAEDSNNVSQELGGL